MVLVSWGSAQTEEQMAQLGMCRRTAMCGSGPPCWSTGSIWDRGRPAARRQARQRRSVQPRPVQLRAPKATHPLYAPWLPAPRAQGRPRLLQASAQPVGLKRQTLISLVDRYSSIYAARALASKENQKRLARQLTVLSGAHWPGAGAWQQARAWGWACGLSRRPCHRLRH